VLLEVPPPSDDVQHLLCQPVRADLEAAEAEMVHPLVVFNRCPRRDR